MLHTSLGWPSLHRFVLLKGMFGRQIAAWHKSSPGGVMGPTGSLTQFLQSGTSESGHGLCRAHCPSHGGELEEVEQSEIPCVRPVGGHSSNPMISSSHSSSGSPTVIALFGALSPLTNPLISSMSTPASVLHCERTETLWVHRCINNSSLHNTSGMTDTQVQMETAGGKVCRMDC